MPIASWLPIHPQRDDSESVAGNRYFAATAVNRERVRPSATRIGCWWKGTVSCCGVPVYGTVSREAARCYAEPKSTAAAIRGYVALWRDVTIED